jgi:hypothetical protein
MASAIGAGTEWRAEGSLRNGHDPDPRKIRATTNLQTTTFPIYGADFVWWYAPGKFAILATTAGCKLAGGAAVAAILRPEAA